VTDQISVIKKSGINEQEIKKVNIKVESIYDLNECNEYITEPDDRRVFVSEGEKE
jgi:uncharacterized protein YggE